MNILKQNFSESFPEGVNDSSGYLNVLFSELFSEYNPEALRILYERLKEIWDQIKTKVEEVLEKFGNLPKGAYLLPLVTLSGCVPQPVEDFLNWVFNSLEGRLVTMPLGLLILLHILGVIGDVIDLFRPRTQPSGQQPQPPHFTVYDFFDRVRNLSSRASIFRSSRGGRRISVGRRGFFISRWLRNVSEYLGSSPPFVRRLVNIIILGLILGGRTPFFNMIRSAIDSAQAWFGIPQAVSQVTERVSKSPYVRFVTEKIEGVSVEIEKIVIEEEQKNMLEALINRTGLKNFGQFSIEKGKLRIKKTVIQRYLRDLGALKGMGDISPYLIFMDYEGRQAYYNYLIDELQNESTQKNRERLQKIKESAEFFIDLIERIFQDPKIKLTQEQAEILIKIQDTYRGIAFAAEEFMKNPPQK
jgi:hypothetical protein